jgi:protein gp37
MKQSKIEWTESTWNPSVGCNKISSGCKFCYAEVMANRLKSMGAVGYEDGFDFKMLPERILMPYRIKKPTKFFVNSMSDLFHEKATSSFLDKVFETISNTPHHTYQILTKREKKLNEYFETRNVPHNVWLGVTVENKLNKKRVDVLRNIDAQIRFLSIEPLLEDIGTIDLTNIHWVIVGGESGHKARPMKTQWVLNIKEQCEAQGVSFFFKQWGTWGADGVKRSKKANGRELLGQEWNDEPHYI